MMKNKMYQSPEMDFKFFCTRDDVLSGSLEVYPDDDLWNEDDLGQDEGI